MGKRPAKNLQFEPTTKEGKKAGIYIRVSSNEFQVSRRAERAQKKDSTSPASQEDSIEEKVRQSVATQRADAIKYCDRQDPPWVYETYEDNEFSGTLGPDERKGLDRLLHDVQAGKIHTVLIRDVKRLARNARLLKEVVDDYLLPNGVELIGLMDNIHISTPYARFFTAILGEVAELEISYIRATSMRNREQAALDGELALNAYSYGYRSAGRRLVEIVPHEAAIVKRIFEDYTINKMSCRDIADALTAEKAPLKNGKATLWRGSRIYAILHNIRYIGKIKYLNHKKLDSPFPPIIDDNLWVLTEQRLKSQALKGPRTQNSINLLTGLIQCPHCLERAKTDPNVRPNLFCMTKFGQAKYYVCQAKHIWGEKVCKGVSVSKERIESFIEKFIGGIAADEFLKFVRDIPDADIDLKKEIQTHLKLIEQNTGKLENLPKRFANSNLGIDFFEKAADEITKDIKRSKDKIGALQIEIDQISQTNQIDAISKLKKWNTLTIQDKREALRTVIKEMVMHRDKLIITLAARPDSPISIPYVPYKKRRRRPDFPDVTDGIVIGEKRGKLVMRVGAEFMTADLRSFRMHIDPVPAENPNREKQDREEAEWYKNHPEYESSEEEV